MLLKPDTTIRSAVGQGTSITASFNGMSATIVGAHSIVYGADNIPLVIVPDGGSAIITSCSDMPSTANGQQINGAMKNPVRRGAQGWDERMVNYSSGARATYPIVVKAGDTVTFAKSMTTDMTTDSNNARRGCVEKYMPVHFVSAAPANLDRYFAPSAIGWPGRGTPIGYSIDIDAAVSALPSRPAGTSIPTFADLWERFSKPAPLIRYVDTDVHRGYEAHLPNGFGGLDVSNYGRYSGAIIGAAGLGLISNAFSTAQKRQLFIAMIRLGIDALDPCKGDSPNVASFGGAHSQYAFIPELIAAHYTGRDSDIPNLQTIDSQNPLRQPFKMTSEQLALCVPHDDLSKPFEFRRRTVAAATENSITLPTNRTGGNGDPTHFMISGYRITRESDGKFAVVNAPANFEYNLSEGNVIDSYEFPIVSQPSPPIAPGDVVYLSIPEFDLAVDQYHWAIDGVNPFRSTFGKHRLATGYRSLSFFTEEVLVARALGLYVSAFDAMEGYVCAVNQGNYPNSSYVYPSQFDEIQVTGKPKWAQSFWNLNATALIPRLN